jgi:hypothetical protein
MFMAFGLRNAAQALQRLKDNILMGLDYVFSFLDDDGVFSKSKEQHWTHLRTLFAILAANSLALNLEKCVFAASELDFLGHCISAVGVAPLRDNVQVILDFPKPTDCKAMQRFLGMINFYRRFLPGVAGTLRPLTAALSGNPKTLPWTPDMETAFAAAKEALVAAVPFAHPLPGAVFALATDASDTQVRVFLQQQVGQHCQPLGFFSKKLSKSEVNYSTFDRELLAAVSGIKHFRSRLEGRPFQLWTDHKPLIFALHRVSPLTSGRQQLHLAFISEYTNQLVYLPGTSNVVADALSRLAAAAAAGVDWVCAAIANKSPLDLKEMALCQILCPQVQALRSSPGLVPRDLRRQVFEHLHGAAHPGRGATRRLISSRYVWKGLSTDVTAWAKACLGSQRAKIHRHVQVPPQHIPVPSHRFSHIYVDLVVPLPASKGFTYLFTIIDRTSCWPEAILSPPP